MTRRSLKEVIAELKANPRKPGSCDECREPAAVHYVCFDERRKVLSVRLGCGAHRDDESYVEGSGYEVVTPENYLAMVVMEQLDEDHV
jgi:hypothetical protein